MGSIGTLIGNGSTINLTGTLNASSTFNLSGGAWYLQRDARINGGTLVEIGSQPVTVIGPATFDGVSIARNVTIGTDATATFAGTWTNHATLQSSGQLTIGGVWTNLGTILLGGGTADLSGTWSSAGLLSATNTTLDLRGSFDVASFTPSNSTVTIRGGWNNQGRTIDLVGGTTWTIHGGSIKGGSIVSSGTALISRGATLDSVTLQAPLFHLSGNLNLSGDWSNQSTQTQTGGGVIFGGTFDQGQIGTFIHRNGSVAFAGTYNGNGTTLDLDQRGWTLHVGNSTINGGTVSGSETNPLRLSSTSVLLNGVTLSVPTTVSSFSRIVVQNGLRLNGSIQLGATSTLSFPGSQSLLGQGTIHMIATSLIGSIEGGTLTIGPDISLSVAGAGAAILGSTGNTVVHQGTIRVQNAGVVATAGTFQNSGTVEVRSGGRLSVGALANYSGGTLSGGHWIVYSNSGIAGIPAILTNNASVLLDGPGSTFTAMNRIQSNLGSFAIDHGRSYTTDGSLTNSGFLGVGTNSTLYVSGTLTNTGSIDLVGTIVVDYDPGDAESTVFQQLASQINTSIFMSLITPAKAIGSADNVDLGLAEFPGSTIDLTTVLLALTFAGDANLDGATDLSDFDRFLAGFSPADTAALWIHGDFDYSGIVDLLDFESYLHGYYASGGSQAAIAAAVQAAPVSDSDRQAMLLLVSTVPEPAAAAMLMLLLGLPRRARARQ